MHSHLIALLAAAYALIGISTCLLLEARRRKFQTWKTPSSSSEDRLVQYAFLTLAWPLLAAYVASFFVRALWFMAHPSPEEKALVAAGTH